MCAASLRVMTVTDTCGTGETAAEPRHVRSAEAAGYEDGRKAQLASWAIGSAMAEQSPAYARRSFTVRPCR